MRRPWLNVDAGELPDEAPELYALAHGVSIACGGHAGDTVSMSHALDMCKLHRCRAGAHPSTWDREGFGRRDVDMPVPILATAVFGQCASLRQLADHRGMRLSHMKPHGALYHAANRDLELARAIVEAAKNALDAQIVIVGPADGALSVAAREAGLGYAREGFADRGTRAEGSLIPRGEPGALITDPVAAARTARTLALGGAVDTLCVHGDSPGALEIARAVRAELDMLACFARLGDRAWVAELPAGGDARALFSRLRALPHARDVVITDARVAIYGDVELAAVHAALVAGTDAAQKEGADNAGTPATHVVRVRYDGEDLVAVARACGFTEAELVARHTQATYDVKMIGFMPGFAYLGSLSEELRVPRRAVPRVRVPAGAVGIAAHYTGIYPFASPGGWNLLGRVVDFVAWDPSRGATLALGDRVRFEAAPPQEGKS